MIEEKDFPWLDSLIGSELPFWNVRDPLEKRQTKMREIHQEISAEIVAGVACEIGDIDMGVLLGAQSLIGRLQEPMSRLQQLKNGVPLWDPSLPEKERLVAIRRVKDDIEAEHAAHLADDDASWVDTGMLLGALNLLDSLLK